MRFALPTVLWALLLVPAAAGVMLAVAALRRRALARFAGTDANVERFAAAVSVHRRAVKAGVLLLALACAVLALARPQSAHGSETLVRRGIDVVLLVDVSRSMAAEDVPPSRLARAVREAKLTMARLEGDRIALVVFAGEPALQCPLTLDHAAIALFLDGLDVESVSVPGTALAEAMNAAAEAFGPAVVSGSEARSRVVLLISDGEDHEGGVEGAEEAVKKAGAQVFAVGVGTADGAPIPQGGSGAYEKDKAGRLVTTRLDEAPLRSLAVDTGGRYYRATPGEAEVASIAEALNALDAGASGTVLKTRWEDRFQIPLGLAIVALLVESTLSDRRKRS